LANFKKGEPVLIETGSGYQIGHVAQDVADDDQLISVRYYEPRVKTIDLAVSQIGRWNVRSLRAVLEDMENLQ